MSTRKFDIFPGEIVLCGNIKQGLGGHFPYHPDVRRLMSARQRRFEFGTEETMALRKKCITASDIATIDGVNPWKKRSQLIWEKFGLSTGSGFRAAMDHGNYYEPEALQVYEAVTGNRLVNEETIGFVKMDETSQTIRGIPVPGYVGATPDAVVARSPILVEVKCPFSSKHPYDEDIPKHYIPQLQCQMAVTGIHTAHFVRYFPPLRAQTGRISVFEVKFDPEKWAKSVQNIRAFYRELHGPPTAQKVLKRLAEKMKKKAYIPPIHLPPSAVCLI